MTSIDEINNVIAKALYTYSDLSCYLFGSYAKAKATATSDVDILLLFDQDVYNFKIITKIKEAIKNDFEEIGIYCDPIYGYIQNINDDKAVLLRQYVGYGMLLYGDDISKFMLQETPEQQKQIEYERYWKSMYLEKIKTLEYLVTADKNINDSSLCWQYLYLIAYWNAKAQLTLIDKQHSLNEFTLVYIYAELLKWQLDKKTLHTLEILQIYMDKIKNDDYFDIEFESFAEHFVVVKNLITINLHSGL